MPDFVVLSDGKNHRSLIEGRRSGLQKVIFAHNSVEDLETRLLLLLIEVPKMIVLESIYSMDGH
jgi:5-aminolevulinate synthase